jgi:uncharacterized protein YndB with AHSA1/START domain
VEVRIAASPETVFDFLVDPYRMIQWMGRSAALDPRPGGGFRCELHKSVALGEYVEVEPPSRVVFTWGWEGDVLSVGPGDSTVEVLLAPDGDGTHLRLVHRDLPTSEAAQKHTQGWDHYLERLAVAASGGDPGPDSWADANTD